MKKYRQLSILLFSIVLVMLMGCSSPGRPDAGTRVNPVDGQVMVRVPAGPFRMGSDEAQQAALVSKLNLPGSVLGAESPQTTLTLSEYWIDQTLVTNAEYKKFLDANPTHPIPSLASPLARSLNWDPATRTYPAHRDQYPVVLVTFHDAVAYCQWAGGRLPTEAEWEKTARGTDGRVWPWGNEFDATKANTVEGGKDDATPAGQFPAGASPYNVLDMAGNVWQWTASLDKPYPYDPKDGREDLQAEGLRIVRGGAWLFGAAITRTTVRNRFEPDDVSLSIGFRCAQ